MYFFDTKKVSTFIGIIGDLRDAGN